MQINQLNEGLCNKLSAAAINLNEFRREGCPIKRVVLVDSFQTGFMGDILGNFEEPV